jgi:putative flippase GtrA
MIDRTLVRFLAVGVGNTVLGLAVIFGARQFFSDVVANLVGYLVVVPISFLTHRDFSFRDQGDRLKAFARYVPTILAGYCANYAVLTVALRAGFNPFLAQTAAIACHVVVTYLLSRIFVFLSPEES